jgi:hypothetical protein
MLRRCAVLCAVFIGVLIAPGDASARTRSFHALKVHKGVATFKVHGVSPRSIRSGRLSGPRQRRFSRRQMRSASRRGVLRVRVSESAASAWSRRRVRRLKLIIVTGDDQPSGRSGRDCAFGVGSWPSACWRPYADTSPLNRLLPTSPKLVSNSSTIVARLLGDPLFAGGPQDKDVGNAGTAGDWSPPTYFAKSTDPLFTVHCTKSWGRCEPEGRQIRIPDQAKPAGGGDGHLGVIQPDGDEYDFWQVQSKPAGGGTITISWGGITRIDGDGLGSNATAAHVGLAGGRVRAQELEAGHIDHALLMVTKCVNGSYVYPAESASATPCTQLGSSNANAPSLGAHFRINYSDAEIDALRVPAWKKTILVALARYGMFITDTGSGSWSYGSFEGGMTYESFGFEDRMVTYAREHGLPNYKGLYIFDMEAGVDWSRLAVVDPCVARDTC